jgi:integrase
MDATILWVIVASRMKSLEIKSKNFGAHSLRHACATQLLHEGSSLPEIAEFLGHRDLKSVSIYAKHDIEALLLFAPDLLRLSAGSVLDLETLGTPRWAGSGVARRGG